MLLIKGYAEAQYDLGGSYVMGHGVDQSNAEALRWFTLAADQGHITAQYIVGLMHAKGQGIAHSYEEGIKWCILAAEQGHGEARAMLGWPEEGEHDAEQSPEETLKIFSINIAKKNIENQNSLDTLYELRRNIGRGCSHEEAMDFLYPHSISYKYKDQTAQKELDRLLGKTSWFCMLQ